MKKYLSLFLICFLVFTFMMVGCSNDNLQRITDDNTSQAIFNYDFNYELYKPGTQMSYAYLWDGYDMNNKFGPNIAKENKLATYLTSYGDIEDYYYLAYISKDTIANGMEWLSNYEKNNHNDTTNYHFSSYQDNNTIDGKYLFMYQNLKDKMNDDIIYYKTNNLNKIKFELNNYQLAYCGRRKVFKIMKNISSNIELNKEVSLYNRYVLSFKDNVAKSYDSFSQEQTFLDNMFDYNGKMLEAFSSDCEKKDVFYLPKLGLNIAGSSLPIRCKLIDKNEKMYVLLPRYELDGGNIINLLSDEVDFSIIEDVFGNYKSLFSEALFEDTKDEDGSFLMAKYDDVLKIISK